MVSEVPVIAVRPGIPVIRKALVSCRRLKHLLVAWHRKYQVSAHQYLCQAPTIARPRTGIPPYGRNRPHPERFKQSVSSRSRRLLAGAVDEVGFVAIGAAAVADLVALTVLAPLVAPVVHSEHASPRLLHFLTVGLAPGGDNRLLAKKDLTASCISLSKRWGPGRKRDW